MTTTRSRSIRRNRISTHLHEQIDRQIHEATSIGREYPGRAVEICLQNRTLLQGTIYHRGRVRNDLTLAMALFNASRYSEALAVLHEVFPMCAAYDSENYPADCHYLFGLVYKELANFSQALLHTEESLQLYRRSNTIEDQARGELLLGAIYLAIGVHDKALEQSLTALGHFQSVDSADGIAKALNNVGNAYNELHDFDRAIEFYEKSLEIKRGLGDSQGVANTLNNIANILFWANQEYDRALEYYHQSLAISTTHGYLNLSAYALQHIGQVHVYLEKYDEALRYSKEGLAISERIGNEYSLAYALMDLGFVYFHLERIEECVESINRGLAIAESIRATSFIGKGYSLLRQIYSSIGDFEKATKFCELFIELQRKTFDAASDRRVQSLTIQFEVEKTRQEKELYRLRTESLRQEMEYKSKELAAMAMYLMQKNEFLSKIGRQIETAGTVVDTAAAELLDSLREQIRETMRSEKNWENFEEQFKLVHHDFIRCLSELCPALTPMELKVGALLRMNLSTKEIANLLYQSPRSIESYRYRLRRKMGIPSSTNLGTFLASL